MKFASGLPNLEIRGYFLFWIGAVLYSIFQVQQASNKLVKKNEYYFTAGWKILNGRKIDVSDYDWHTVKFVYYDQFLWLCGHLIISEVLRWKNYTKFIPFIQIIVTITYLFLHFELKVFLLIFFQPLLFNLISNFRLKRIVWICELICLLFLQLYKNEFYFDNVPHEVGTLILVTVYWMNLRCVCYSICKIEDSSKCGIVSLFSYCLYLPLFSTGPFVDFKDFLKSQEQCNEVTFTERLKKLSVNLARFIFWMFFTDFILHYIYVSSITFSPKIVQKFDSWTLYGFGYCMGQFFHLKYVVLYGISTTLAKFENIPAPDTPKCIGRIHLYSDMWRYFDCGLYKFLVRYMYVPLAKMKILSLFASFICFCFIFLWHGTTMDILLWSFLNYLCVNIESIFSHVYNNYFAKKCEKILDEAWRQRISCMLAAPLLAISAISNFYFFAGTEIGYIFFKRYFTGHLQMYIVLLFSLYCCSQVSSYMRKKDLDTKKRKLQ